MDTVTIERLDNLYWLGRYIERVYQSLHIYMDAYDKLIDTDPEYYKAVCAMLGLPNVYRSKEDFIYGFGFDTNNPGSILSNLYRAYDNAMVMRDEISTHTLSYIHLAVAELKKAAHSDAPIFGIQRVEDNLLAFWGCLDDEVDEESTRNAVKVGKRIERLDMFLRQRKPREELAREIDRLAHRITTTTLIYSKAALMHTAAMIEEDPIDYEALLEKIPQIV